MSRYVFVPITDELLYERPELIQGPIIPYVPGRPCHHWLSVELNPPEDELISPGNSKRAYSRIEPSSQTLDVPARRSFYPT